ncbi:hypothetical protein [Clostridium oryzae]|uniref:Uncharacterized protein n=1 Tax=Clostridium oryzae TaxID=1450648 RepID=A0A1V4I3Q9_9CLOT|nr:hypothetical protein [Clostridium oryzae]OPJ54612.1 hypothetical protein CLORY_45420 [Clostridium oryzae]
MRVLWKGFNHELNDEGDFEFSEEEKLSIDEEMLRPNVDLNLKIAAVTLDGNFAAYCGMWYDPTNSIIVLVCDHIKLQRYEYKDENRNLSY